MQATSGLELPAGSGHGLQSSCMRYQRYACVVLLHDEACLAIGLNGICGVVVSRARTLLRVRHGFVRLSHRWILLHLSPACLDISKALHNGWI